MNPEWLEQIGVGLASIGGAAGLRESYNWSRARQGDMAGYWMWITYSRKDGLPWTVEIAYLTHYPRKGEERFEGTAWRVYDRQRPQCHWRRRWAFTGWGLSDGFAGVYRHTRDPAGGDGTMKVAPNHPSIKGMYTVSNSENLAPDSGSEIPLGEEIEWLKWPDHLTEAMRNVVACIPLDKSADLFPWHIRRKLGLPSLAMIKVVGALPFASAVVDPNLVMALRRAEIESGRLKEPKLPDKPLTRTEIVGDESVVAISTSSVLSHGGNGSASADILDPVRESSS